LIIEHFYFNFLLYFLEINMGPQEIRSKARCQKYSISECFQILEKLCFSHCEKYGTSGIYAGKSKIFCTTGTTFKSKRTK